MFARTDGVKVVHTYQSKQRGYCAGDALAKHFAVFVPIQTGGIKRRKDTDRNARIGAGCVNGKVNRVFEVENTFGSHAPFLQAIAPGSCGFHGCLLLCLICAAYHFRVDPWLKILRQQFREMQEQIGQVAFGIDDDGRYAIERCFFKQGNA